MQSIQRLLVAGVLGLGALTTAQATPVYAVTDTNTLIRFDTSTPGAIFTVGTFSGVGQIRGIDFRPATGQLFALSGNNNLYTINVLTGAATFVAAVSVPVTNNNLDIDFNPSNGMLRITNPDDQNLAVNPTTGVATVQTPLNGPGANANPTIVGSAYTNASGAANTTLYDIDSRTDSLYTQVPATGALTLVGALGVDTTNDVGFDIFAFNNAAFASLTLVNGGPSGFYSINLNNGTASLIGLIGGGVTIRDIALQQVPEPASIALLGLGLVGLAIGSRRKRA